MDKFDFDQRQQINQQVDFVIEDPEKAAEKIVSLEAENARLKQEKDELEFFLNSLPGKHMVDRLKQEKTELVEALKDIKNPLQRLQRGLPEGHKLDGHTITSLLNSVELYKSLAREALVKIKD